MRRILVGVDFSAPSRIAAQWAALHFGSDTEIVLMHVIHIPEPLGMIGGSEDHRIQRIETSRRGAQLRLAELKSALGTHRVRVHIRVGSPAEELARAARQAKADLIVVGKATERSGLYRVIGGTVEGLIRRSLVPVLRYKGSPESAPKRLLVAVDDSARAPGVLREAEKFAALFHTDVTVLHVVSSGLVGVVAIASGERERRQAIQQIESSAAMRIEATVAALRETGVWAEALIVSGDPASKILGVSRELGADLIVIGLRHPSRLERALVGNVAHQILREADCSVLVALGG